VQFIGKTHYRSLLLIPWSGVCCIGECRCDFRFGEPGTLAEHGDVHTPFVFGTAACAGTQDHQLPLAQVDCAAVEQVARKHALQDARAACHRTK
jgi:hypothetical protein